MKRNPHIVLVIVATTLACDPISRNVGDLQSGGSESIDLVAYADAFCQAQEDCCPADLLEATGLWYPSLCRAMKRDELEGLAAQAAGFGLQADPTCFEVNDDCWPQDASECEPPCKLFFGPKAVDEPCDGDSYLDDCAQGLVCQAYGYHEWICDDGVSQCAGYDSRCVDPCATNTDVACDALDWPSTCGPDAYCDDAWWSEDEVPGTCRTLAAMGSVCDPLHSSCVAGAFCDAEAAGGPVCTATYVDGTPCNGDDQCTSGRCGTSTDPDVQAGTCAEALSDWCPGL